MGRMKTPEQFVSEVFELVGNEYEVLEQYKGSEIKIKMKHKECGNEYSVRPANFINISSRCPKCASGGTKKTHEEFVNEVFELVGDEYEVKGEYKSAATKIKIKHKECGNEYSVEPTNFISSSSRCPWCAIGGTKKPHEKFVEEVHELVGDEYTVLGRYKRAVDKVAMLHNECGNKYNVTPSGFLKNRKCPKCVAKQTGRKNALTTEEYKKRLKKIHGKDYLLISSYKNAKSQVKVKHLICSHEWTVFPYVLLKNRGCPECLSKVEKVPRTMSHSDFMERVIKAHGDKYEAISEYRGYHETITMSHLSCGESFVTKPNILIAGSGCRECSRRAVYKKTAMTHQEYLIRVNQEVGNEYEPLERYVLGGTPTLMRHNACGHEWKVAPSAFLNNGTRCGKCNESKGERRISEYLDNNLYSNQQEFRIKECRNILPLPFDFAVFNESSLMCLIEFEGEQHYSSVKNWGGEEEFRRVQYRDQIKRDYCKDNGIPLIEIPYWEQDNIEIILDAELNKIEKKSAPINFEVRKKESILL